jgi:hypothetical protein
VPCYKPSLVPYISSTSSTSSHPDEEMPVVTLGTPFRQYRGLYQLKI